MQSGNRRVVIAAATAMIIFTAMSTGYVLNWVWLDTLDTASLRLLHDFGATRPGWVSFWIGVSMVFAPRVFQIIGLIGIVVGLIRPNYRIALFLFISVEMMGPVLTGAKWLADRPRPTTAFVDENSTSFPSGHAFCVMVGVLALGMVVWPAVPRRWRFGLGVLGVAVIVMVGFARVALNVHHPSDVVAGWALGYVFYLLCVQVIQALETRDWAGSGALKIG